MASNDNKNIHSKIIKEVCKEILLPLGAFQKGTSRTYLDDNDYYFTVVEFQPSSWNRGTYLNIGLTFLWNDYEYLSFGFSRQIAARYGSFVMYENDEQFRKEVSVLANIAKEEILFYRKLKDKIFAKDWMLNYGTKEKNSFDKSMICILNDDVSLAKEYYRMYMETSDYKYRKEKGSFIPYSLEQLDKEFIISNIKRKRMFWHSKPSMKKMPVSSEYDK